MQITALLCRSGFNDLESTQAKWLLILLQREMPTKPEPRATRSLSANGLILAAFPSLFQSDFFTSFLRLNVCFSPPR